LIDKWLAIPSCFPQKRTVFPLDQKPDDFTSFLDEQVAGGGSVAGIA